ncbi:MAG TPA: hypothetical protein VKU40_03075, partial [Thermoanaerobaculia bacterium]|nr:hypothetical protein [Thermoanaerobaculia bacterium]
MAAVVLFVLAGCGPDTDGVLDRTLKQRRFEVRLSTGDAWHACPPVRPEELAPVTCAELPPLVEPPPEESGDAVLRSATPAGRDEVPDLHRGGLLSLLQENYDRAVERLAAAAEAAPEDSAVLNDLASAHFVRAG